MDSKDTIFLNSLNEFKHSVYFANKGQLGSINNANDVYTLAVKLAYKDLQWRTIKKHNNDLKESNIRIISNLIKENIEKGETHLKLINDVSLLFEKDFGNVAPEQCFGKAQKVVNMSFKYLYCINSQLVQIDYSERDIPLDDRIFDFYYSYRKYKRYSLKDRVTSWSTIEQNTYIEIQENLKEYVKEVGLDMNPIECEFIIWNYSTTKLVVDTYNSAKKSYDKVINNEPLIDSFNFINNKLK